MYYKIAILTEYKESIGYGHVVRTSAILETLVNKNLKVDFIVDSKLEINIGLNYPIKYRNWLQIGIDSEYDILIVDTYSIQDEIWDNLKNYSKIISYMDDGNVSVTLTNIVLIKTAIEAKKEKNKIQLIGTKFFPIRESLRNVSKHNSSEIFVMFGGTDIRALSIKLLPLFCNSQNLKFNIVTANENIYKELKLKKTNNINIYFSPNWNELALLMASAKLAISSGGTILYELAYFNIPTIPIEVIDNQKLGLEEFKKIGFINEYFKYNEEYLLEKINNKLIDSIKNYEKYILMAGNGQRIVDGEGSERIVDELIKIRNSL